MPDIIAHATIAKELIELIQDEKRKEILKENEKLLILGAQGPDPFFFYQMFALKKNKSYRKFGGFMHDNDVDEFLSESIRYLRNHYSDALYAYVIGFLCHHALDSHAHPYIYHVTGKENRRYRGNHLRLERAIDSIFLKERWNVNPNTFNIRKEVLDVQPEQAIFGPYYDYLLRKVFNKEEGGRAFLKAVKTFQSVFGFLHDPHGRKKRFFTFIDKHFNKKSLVVLETLFHYDNIKPGIDYLNLSHRDWHHPVDDKEVSTKSFLDLFNEALNEAYNETLLVNRYLDGEFIDLSKFIENTSYTTGKDWHTGNKMEYFNVIFKQ